VTRGSGYSARMLRSCAVAIALWSAAACGNPGKPAAPPSPPPPPAAAAGPPEASGLDRDYPQLAERAVKLYEAVAEAFRAAGVDCGQATTRLNGLAGAYRDVVAANEKVLHEGRARELKAALEKHGDQLDAAAKAIMESQTLARCGGDPAFTRAFDDLVGAPP
jgi:hypothetical protein